MKYWDAKAARKKLPSYNSRIRHSEWRIDAHRNNRYRDTRSRTTNLPGKFIGSNAATHYLHRIRRRRGFSTEVAYAPEWDLWYAQQIQDKKCWNGFGIGAPIAGKKVALAAEINFPAEGLNRALSGVFARDENGRVFVLHRGKIRGGKALFFRHYHGETVSADDGGKPDDFARIAALDDAAFAGKLADFVRQIIAIKAAAKKDSA